MCIALVEPRETALFLSRHDALRNAGDFCGRSVILVPAYSPLDPGKGCSTITLPPQRAPLLGGKEGCYGSLPSPI